MRKRSLSLLSSLLITSALACGAQDGAPYGDPVAEANQDLSGSAPTDVVVRVLAERGPSADVGHPVAHLDLPANTPCGALTTDAENAMLHAAAFARLPAGTREAHAAAAASILNAWARAETTFAGPNGFLCAAWNVGAMARVAFVLKSRRAPEYARIAGDFERYAAHVAETYWLPRDGVHALADTKPELVQGWELTHVSNRTMAVLESTLHVARLVGDRAWFDASVALYDRLADVPPSDAAPGTTFFLDATGKNGDDDRGDDWHRTAGLAACIQIGEVVRSETGRDLFHAHDGILRRSVERYGEIALRDHGTDEIPFWDTAARAYPKSPIARDAAARLRSMQTSGYVPYLVTYAWGFGELLDRP